MKFLCEMVEDNFIATGDKSSECPHILVYIHNVHVHVPVLVHVFTCTCTSACTCTCCFRYIQAC